MSSDCLVLYFEEELESNNNPNTLFLIYDPLKKSFFIWGKRKNNETIQMQEYSFQSKSKRRISQFIQLVMNNNVCMSLHNFAYLPNSCQDITYNYLNSIRRPNNCIITDDETKIYDGRDLLFFLRIIKNIKNDYTVL